MMKYEGDTYQCNDCKARFKQHEVELKPFGNNFELVGTAVTFINKDGIPCRGSTSEIQEGDQSMHCPKCGMVHLFGFDVVKAAA